MLDSGQIVWIKRLARDGLSQRAISRATGVARDTVQVVLAHDRVAPELRDTLYDVDDPVFTRPPARCDGCGAVVYRPCLACTLRQGGRGKKGQAAL